MPGANDNEQDDIVSEIAKAKRMLGDSCEKGMDDLCSLTRGGKCPLLSSLLVNLYQRKEKL